MKACNPSLEDVLYSTSSAKSKKKKKLITSKQRQQMSSSPWSTSKWLFNSIMQKVDMMPDTLTQVMVVKGLKLNRPQKENMVTLTEESCGNI